MRKFPVFIVLISAVSWSISAAAGASTDPNPWELVKKAEGVEVYQRNVPNSDLVAFKGEGILDYSISRLASILLDTARAAEWVIDLVESRVVQRLAPLQYIEYNHIGTPFIIKDREFVSHVDIVVDPKAKEFGLRYNPAALHLNQNVPQTGFVRGELKDTFFMLQALEKNKTKVSAQMFADPKGSVPKWVVNFFQKSWPVDTFEALRRQAAKGDIRRAPQFLDVIEKVEKFEKE